MAARPQMVTSAMKSQRAERTGSRRAIFGVRPNEAFYEEKREIGLKEIITFPFTGAEKYVGDWNKNTKEGFGTQYWTKGHKYEGEWAANKRNGKGTYWVCEKGSLRKQYTGDWLDDKRHGVGVFVAQNGDRFEGEWQFGKSHGMGKMFYGPEAPEASFNGSWSNGVRSGLGILTFKNGDRFEGHWRDSQKEGPGRYFYKATNQVYEGEWVNNAPKCGELKAAPPGSFPPDADEYGGSPGGNQGNSGSSSASLPLLRLLGPETVVSDAVASVRRSRASETGDAAPAFTEDQMGALRERFDDADPTGRGFLRCGDLWGVVSAAGLEVSEDLVNQVVASLEADEDAVLTFNDFVDVVAILMDVGGGR